MLIDVKVLNIGNTQVHMWRS